MFLSHIFIYYLLFSNAMMVNLRLLDNIPCQIKILGIENVLSLTFNSQSSTALIYYISVHIITITKIFFNHYIY